MIDLVTFELEFKGTLWSKRFGRSLADHVKVRLINDYQVGSADTDRTLEC